MEWLPIIISGIAVIFSILSVIYARMRVNINKTSSRINTLTTLWSKRNFLNYDEFIYDQMKSYHQNSDHEPEQMYEEISKIISSKFHTTIKYDKETKLEDWYVLNEYLNYIETVCYFSTIQKDTQEDVKEIFGNEFIEAYKFFIYTILKHRSHDTSKSRMFKHFTNFIEQNYGPQTKTYLENAEEKIIVGQVN